MFRIVPVSRSLLIIFVLGLSCAPADGQSGVIYAWGWQEFFTGLPITGPLVWGAGGELLGTFESTFGGVIFTVYPEGNGTWGASRGKGSFTRQNGKNPGPLA